MFNIIGQTRVILDAMIEKDVGSIIGVLVNGIGFVMNFLFNFIYTLTEKHSLGLTIIFVTFIIRLVMLPQGISSQKSQMKMRKVQPEIDKIKKKYGNSKDPEIQKKINMETQAVYQKHKINLFGGCLPLIITLPIFYALSDLMRRTYIYVGKINDLYVRICETIYRGGAIVNGVPAIADTGSVLNTIAGKMVPSGMRLDTRVATDLVRFIDKFSTDSWEAIKASITTPGVLEDLNVLLKQRDNIQNFLGMNLVNTAGLGFPGIIIPILSAATSFLLSWVSMKMTPQTGEASGKMNQRIMMIVMPAMMFFLSISVSGGVGVFWIASNAFALLQQIFLNKIYMKRLDPGGDIIGKAEAK